MLEEREARQEETSMNAVTQRAEEKPFLTFSGVMHVEVGVPCPE